MFKEKNCCILNGGDGSWAFSDLARRLSDGLWIDISEKPRDFNYLLYTAQDDIESHGRLFIPMLSVTLASDKRLLVSAFNDAVVPTPVTHLAESLDEAQKLRLADPSRKWCLKYPTGCGASGHRLLEPGMTLPPDWPLPLVVQEFVFMRRPEVYRLYCAGGQLFGWVARRFPSGVRASPWVAHARGARYEAAGDAPPAAIDAARRALVATGLINSFGCADLIRRENGEWLVLEVGTDGLHNHVDRDLGLHVLEREILRFTAEAFWASAGGFKPWGEGEWRPRSEV